MYWVQEGLLGAYVQISFGGDAHIRLGIWEPCCRLLATQRHRTDPVDIHDECSHLSARIHIIYIYIHSHTCIHAYIYVCMCVCMCVCGCVHTIDACMHMKHIHTNIYIYRYTIPAYIYM